MALSLHTPHGVEGVALNCVQTLTFAAVDGAQALIVQALGAGAHSAEFSLASLNAGAGINAGLATLIDGLAAYAGRTATITGALVATGSLWSGTLTLTFDGGVAVPAVQVIGGAIQTLVVTAGDGGNYTLNTGANFSLGETSAQLQTNQRALGGNHANVNVAGSSTAPVSGGFTFSGSGNPLFNGTFSDTGFSHDGFPVYSGTNGNGYLSYILWNGSFNNEGFYTTHVGDGTTGRNTSVAGIAGGATLYGVVQGPGTPDNLPALAR